MSELTSHLLAAGVMAATEKVVSQALAGAWSEVPQTLEQRRELLDQLRAQTAPSTPWLQALQQAVVESDATLKAIAPAAVGSSESPAAVAGEDSLHIALRQSLMNHAKARG